MLNAYPNLPLALANLRVEGYKQVLTPRHGAWVLQHANGTVLLVTDEGSRATAVESEFWTEKLADYNSDMDYC